MILKVINLNAGYEKFQVLFDVNVTLEEKKITAVLGPNGSGKSTLFKTIFGLTNIYSGKIIFDGKDITGIKSHKAARIGIAYLPQTENVFSELTIKENLLMAGYTLKKEELESRISEVLEIFPVLKRKYNNKAYTLSGGERQMLAIAMNLLRKPKLMLFDEPTANLAPVVVKEILNIIVSLKDKYGITIGLVEQNAIKALEISENAYLLVGGKVIFGGKPEELLSDKELGKLYLGLK